MALLQTLKKHLQRDRFLKHLYVFQFKIWGWWVPQEGSNSKNYKYAYDTRFHFTNELELSLDMKEEILRYVLHVSGGVRGSSRIVMFLCIIGFFSLLGGYLFDKNDMGTLLLSFVCLGIAYFFLKREIRLSRELIQKLARFSPQNALYLREKGLLED